MTHSTNPIPAAPVLKSHSSIKVLGVGGAGCNAVNHLARESFAGVTFAVLNTDAASLSLSSVSPQITLGAKSTRGLGAGGDPDRGRAAAEEDAETIRSLCLGAEVVFVVAGLGGGTGTGAGPVVARLAKESGALVLAIVILPFECEGSRRQRQAARGLHDLKGNADSVICLPNQKVFKLVGENASLLDAFRFTNELVAQGVRSIWRLLSQPGLINVDFADLCVVTRDKHSESTLAKADGQGEGRAREVVEKLMRHPLIEDGQTLAEASELLVCLAGGPDLTLAEVNRVVEQINRHCDQAHLILGATIDPALTGRLEVTVVASRRNVLGMDGGVRGPAGNVEGPPFVPDLNSSAFDGAADPKNAQGGGRGMTPAQGTSARLDRGARREGRKSNSRWRQGQLELEMISRGRFDKSEPTILHGEDLDVPTYIRRGVSLN